MGGVADSMWVRRGVARTLQNVFGRATPFNWPRLELLYKIFFYSSKDGCIAPESPLPRPAPYQMFQGSGLSSFLFMLRT